VGFDPVIGRGDFPQHWPRQQNGCKSTGFLFRNYVTPKGWAYFFAPSLEFLERIKEISTDKPRKQQPPEPAPGE
jgi:hypothetical protein